MKKIGLLLLTLCLAASVPAFADGTINMANPSAGTGWTFSGNVVTITADGNYTVTGSSSTNHIVINKEVTATITLQNANIHSAAASPFMLSSDNTAGGRGSQVTLNLVGNNELVTTDVFSAGLTVEDSARIIIQGDGSLLAQGAGSNPHGGAGIGGGDNKTAGTVIIQSGTITATGGFGSAGIGGGVYEKGGSITITGGSVTATGGRTGAGIGGGYTGDGGNITIRGGVVVVASGGEGDPAGIGGGAVTGGAGTITITGGTVYASSGEGTGIGGTWRNISGAVNITGGTVIANKIGNGINGEYLVPHISGANTIVLSPSINTATFGGATVLTGANVEVSAYINTGDTIADVTLHADFTIPSGCTLTVPAGIVFDVNHKRLTVNGALVKQGEMINEDYIPPARDINLSAPDNNRDGWTYLGNVVTITSSGDRTITGSSDAVRVVIEKDVTAVITLNNVRIHSGDQSPFMLTSDDTGGSQVTLRLVGNNELVATGPYSAGLKVPNNARLTIEGSGSLVAVSPGGIGDPAGIGGGGFGNAGTINITGGTVYASGSTGPGIGAGAGATEGVINITGGTVIADEIGIAGIGQPNESRTATHISGASAVVLSPSINTATFGGAQVLTGTNIGISCSVLPESMDYKVTLNAALTIPSGATLIVPAGIVFDVNHKVLTNHGTISNYGSIINAGNLTGNQPNTVTESWIDSIPAQTYTGDSIKPAVVVKDGSKTLTLNTDYTVEYRDNVNMGTATATVTGKGNYTGSASKTFIIAKPLAGVWIEDIPPLPYTGDSIKPAVTVRDGIITLTSGTDYTVTYTNNIHIGAATVTVTGTGYYAGTIVKSFTIAPKPLTAGSIQEIPAQAWTGDSIVPAVVVRDGSRILTPGTDYTVAFTNNVKAGLGMVTITGKGNYSGSAVGFFDILPREIAVEWLADVPPQTWTGKAIEPAVTVRDGDRTLIAGTDYKEMYSNNVNPGSEAWVSVTGMGNYTGTKSKNFAIIVVPPADTIPADTVPKAVTGVSFYNDSYIVKKSNALQLLAVIEPADAGNRNVSWATSNGAVATVSGGRVTAVAAGEATIVATTEDGGYSATCRIRVLEEVITEDRIQYNIIEKEVIRYNITDRDTVVYHIISEDSTVYNLVTKDSTDYNITTVDSVKYDITIRDSVIYNLTARDTVVYNIITKDSIHYTPVPERIYIVTDITGAEHVVTEDARVVRAGTVLRIEGLKPGKTFSIYTIKGEKYYSGTAQSDVFRLDNIPEGLYILYHDGQYSKFSY